MTDLAKIKAVTRAYMAEFDAAPPNRRLDVLKNYCTEDYHWRGLHPFHEQPNAEAAIAAFWQPFLTAFTHSERRETVFFAGLNDCDEQATTWTCSMGQFRALFDAPWLGISPTRKTTLLRYAEFHQIRDGKIAQTALFVDILDLIWQAGLWPLSPMTGAPGVFPPPLTNDGQQFEPQDPAKGEKTLHIINNMSASITDANAILQGKSDAQPMTPQEELRLNWHEDMAWYGPAGIGATFTIDRYVEQHQKPFRTQLSDRTFHGHVARIAEGNYGGFFGWPNLTVTPSNGYLGMPKTNAPADMRVVDIYRRDGDKLAENWIFIDLPHFLNQQGFDVLAKVGNAAEN